MKITLPIFICALLATGCCVVTFLLLNYTNLTAKKIIPSFSTNIELNTHEMIEADTGFLDRYFSVLSTYECRVKNVQDEDTPWADVFVCEMKYKAISLPDTVLLLAVNKGQNYEEPDNIEIYWPEAELAKKYNKCNIRVPAEQINMLKRYKYVYADIIWVTDCGNL